MQVKRIWADLKTWERGIAFSYYTLSNGENDIRYVFFQPVLRQKEEKEMDAKDEKKDKMSQSQGSRQQEDCRVKDENASNK